MLQRIREGQIRNLKDAREAGFTLIELLIVIVVLGVLAGIVVFGVSTFKKDSEDAACKATKKTVEVAAEAWNAKNGSYTNDISELVNGRPSATPPIAGGYLKAVPVGVTLNNGVASGNCV